MAKDKVQKVKIVGDTLGSPVKDKPSIRLDETDFPEVKNLKIDDEVTLIVKAKLQHLGREEYSNDKKVWGRFTVESVKTDGETDPLRKGMDSVKVEHPTRGK